MTDPNAESTQAIADEELNDESLDGVAGGDFMQNVVIVRR
jgi:hypothetical protein